jgi:hypothetical protein
MEGGGSEVPCVEGGGARLPSSHPHQYVTAGRAFLYNYDGRFVGAKELQVLRTAGTPYYFFLPKVAALQVVAEEGNKEEGVVST